MTRVFTGLCFIALLMACRNNQFSKKVKPAGIITIVNGMDKPDSLKYTCDSCEKYIRNEEIFKRVIDQATLSAKQSLRNPLSFIPRSVKLDIFSADSLYYFDTGKRVDSCLIISVSYKSIGKNAYGTEGEVNTESIIYLVADSIRYNFAELLKKEPLSIIDGTTINRRLYLSDVNEPEDHFSVLPTLSKPYLIIIESSLSCVDKDARLTLHFEDGTKIILNNWNDFNCNGTSYFSLTENTLQQLKTKKMRYMSFYDNKTIFCNIPGNESDYLMQYANLITGK